ncbi:28458_t:CDS:2, partial [Dentiscutata erythropus]
MNLSSRKLIRKIGKRCSMNSRDKVSETDDLSAKETVDANLIQKTEVENEFLVLNTRQNGLFYTVNTAIGTCTCSIGINGAPCKHQGAVATKFHITSLNFLPSLTADDRMVYTYIAR